MSSLKAEIVTRSITMENTGSREIDYPLDCTNKKKYKERQLKQHPHILFADYKDKNGERIKANLIFYTSVITRWKSSFCQEYRDVDRNPMTGGDRLVIYQDENRNTDPILTISLYTNGTVLVQSYEASLDAFEEIFPRLRAGVEGEGVSPPSTPDHQQTDGLEEQGQTDESAEERDQPQTTAGENITELTNNFSKMKSK